MNYGLIVVWIAGLLKRDSTGQSSNLQQSLDGRPTQETVNMKKTITTVKSDELYHEWDRVFRNIKMQYQILIPV